MTVTLPSLTLVLGGAASGKSLFAERLLTASRRPLTYVATAQAMDQEMHLKIIAHQGRRGDGWTTVEAPLDLRAPLDGAAPGGAVLVDCATLWLSNHLMAGSDLDAEEARLIEALAACPAPVVVVSNEVGGGIVPENPQARRFRNAQGRLNQKLAARADLVVAVMAGLPMALKGALPEGIA